MQEFADAEQIKQQLCYTRRALTAKQRKMKALSAETIIKDREIKVKDSDLKQLRQDLCDKKEILLREKRDKQKLKCQLDAIKNQMVDTGIFERPIKNAVASCTLVKTTGAGFRVYSASISE